MNTPPSSLENLLASLARLSDRQVLEHVGRMARDERNATARLIASLAEVDRRQLYRGAGCSSLFGFCTDVLRLSESEAYLRIEAARAARRFPLVLERLVEASITLTAVSKLSRHLTEENHRALLDAVRHASKREIDEILAGLCPRPDAKEMVRRLPERTASAASAASVVEQPRDRSDERVIPTDGIGGLQDRREEECSARSVEGRPSGSGEASRCADGKARPAAFTAPPRNSVLALAPQRYRVQLTIGVETNEKLSRARDLLRHEVPDGDLAEIFDRALTRLLAELEKRRFAATQHPKAKRRPAPRRSLQVAAGLAEKALPPAPATRERTEPLEAPRPTPASRPPATAGEAGSSLPPEASPPSYADSRATGHAALEAGRRSRHIPAAVKREVWLRDEGRCTFVGSHGRCRERGMLEYHHREPFAAGGEATVSNVTLLCRAHNTLEAERVFGPIVPAIRGTAPSNSTAGMQEARERIDCSGHEFSESRTSAMGDSTPSRRSS